MLIILVEVYVLGMPTEYVEHGFLSDKITNSIPEFRKAAAPWFNLYFDLNQCAQQQMLSASAVLKNDDMPSLFVFSLYYRLINTYQSVLLLVERGLDTDSKALLRNMLETLFVMKAIANDRSFARIYLLSNERSRINLLDNVVQANKLLKSQRADVFLTDGQLDEMRNEVAAFRKANPRPKGKGGKPLSDGTEVFNIAAKAGLRIMYMQHYIYLCDYAHPSHNGMREFFEQDAMGNIVSYRTGRNDGDAAANLRISMTFLLGALDVINTVYKLDLEKEMLPQFCKRLDEVIDDSPHQKRKITDQ